jgi:hypothetical protein
MAKVLTSDFRIDHELTCSQTYQGGQLTLFISLGLLKLDWTLLLQSTLTPGRDTRRIVVNISIGVMALWTISRVFSIFIHCSAKGLSPQTPSQTCSGLWTRYLFLYVTDATTDIYLALLPVYLIMQVQISWSKKLRVVIILALRCTPIVPASLFFFKWQGLLHSDNPGTAQADAVALQEAQLWWSMFIGMVIRLRELIKRFNTNSGMNSGVIQPSVRDACELDRDKSTQKTSSSTRQSVETPMFESSSDIELQGFDGEHDCASQKSTTELWKS